jgi:hypothetical protein
MSSVPLSAKQAQYTQLSQLMRQYFERLIGAYATAQFYNTAWGGVTSNSIDYDTMYAGYFGTALYEDLWI